MMYLPFQTPKKLGRVSRVEIAPCSPVEVWSITIEVM